MWIWTSCTSSYTWPDIAAPSHPGFSFVQRTFSDFPDLLILQPVWYPMFIVCKNKTTRRAPLLCAYTEIQARNSSLPQFRVVRKREKVHYVNFKKLYFLWKSKVLHRYFWYSLQKYVLWDIMRFQFNAYTCHEGTTKSEDLFSFLFPCDTNFKLKTADMH